MVSFPRSCTYNVYSTVGIADNYAGHGDTAPRRKSRCLNALSKQTKKKKLKKKKEKEKGKETKCFTNNKNKSNQRTYL